MHLHANSVFLEDTKDGFAFCVFTYMNVKHIITYMLDKYITPERLRKKTIPGKKDFTKTAGKIISTCYQPICHKIVILKESCKLYFNLKMLLQVFDMLDSRNQLYYIHVFINLVIS